MTDYCTRHELKNNEDWICVQKGCDGTHHYMVKWDDKINGLVA